MSAHTLVRQKMEDIAEDLRDILSRCKYPTSVKVNYPFIDVTPGKGGDIKRIRNAIVFRLCPSGAPISNPEIVNGKIKIWVDVTEMERLLFRSAI